MALISLFAISMSFYLLFLRFFLSMDINLAYPSPRSQAEQMFFPFPRLTIDSLGFARLPFAKGLKSQPSVGSLLVLLLLSHASPSLFILPFFHPSAGACLFALLSLHW